MKESSGAIGEAGTAEASIGAIFSTASMAAAGVGMTGPRVFKSNAQPWMNDPA
jgi:hypothetical protein